MVGYEDAGVLGVGAEYTAPGKHHVTTDDDQARRLHGNIASPKVFIGMGYGRIYLMFGIIRDCGDSGRSISPCLEGETAVAGNL